MTNRTSRRRAVIQLIRTLCDSLFSHHAFDSKRLEVLEQRQMLTTALFNWDFDRANSTPQAVEITFDGDVGASVTEDDFQFLNLTTGQGMSTNEFNISVGDYEGGVTPVVVRFENAGATRYFLTSGNWELAVN